MSREKPPAEKQASSSPRVLFVDTTYGPERKQANAPWDKRIDFHLYDDVPRWWRRLENALRIDLYLAKQAAAEASDYDVVFAGSERVAIPLAMQPGQKPIVTLVDHMASPKKRAILRLLRITGKWARLGCFSEADRHFLEKYYGYPKAMTFNYLSAPIDQIDARFVAANSGPIISAGATQRDYATLFAALRSLPEVRATMFIGSRFTSSLGTDSSDIPPAVRTITGAPFAEVIEAYHDARFAVVPMHDSTHFSAGATAALEAMAAGKPVIATSTAGMREYVVHKHTGLLVEPYDVKGMQQAIAQLWNDPELVLQMGKNARRHVEQNYDPHTAAEALKLALREAHAINQRYEHAPIP